jgi:hypothetical protein
MPATRRRNWLALLPLLLFGAAPASRAQEAPPAAAPVAAPPEATPAAHAGPALVVAIDTSRSLSQATLAATLAEVGRLLDALPAGATAGVLAFDDAPRWSAEPGSSPAAAKAALSALKPQGSYTLLHDALFEAARRLDHGGVILLVTDGRDENSATTVEDIARRCEAQKVRILSAGTGARIEEKALRRLALLTRGDYLGKGLAAARAAPAVTEHLRIVAADQEAERKKLAAATAPPRRVAEPAEPAARPDAAPPAPAPVKAEPRVETSLLDYLPWILLALLGLAFLLYVTLRQRAARSSAAAELESQRAEEEFQVADEADAAAIRLELAQVPVSQPRESPEVTVDTAVLQRMSLDERLERTSVLSSMLILRKPGEAPRSFLLDRDKAFSVGRDREKNTLAVPDPALSSQHFRVVPRAGVYYFVDLESTNGSYIGMRKVRAKRLRTGDVIRAGQVEFEYQSYGEAA